MRFAENSPSAGSFDKLRGMFRLMYWITTMNIDMGYPKSLGGPVIASAFCEAIPSQTQGDCHAALENARLAMTGQYFC